jgi:SAM-dependent methyltransferase
MNARPPRSLTVLAPTVGLLVALVATRAGRSPIVLHPVYCNREEGPVSRPIDIDLALLKSEIEQTYAQVAEDPGGDFIFPTGRAWAQELGYPQPELANVHDASAASLAGVANPFSLGHIEAGETVLGVIDLTPDKEAVFAEIDRVLRPGGRLQLADVVIHREVSEDARKRIDLWTG